MWTDIDKKNKKLLEDMKEKNEIIYGLEEGNVPITLNDLIRFCKEENIDFDKPLLLECPGGYFPLAFYHNGVGYNEDGSNYKLDCLVITDGNW